MEEEDDTTVIFAPVTNNPKTTPKPKKSSSQSVEENEMDEVTIFAPTSGFQPKPQPVVEVKPVDHFNQLQCYGWLKSRITAISLKSPTLIQKHTIPAALAGRNVIGASPTGTGKTLCFAVPILQSLSSDPHGGHSLILTPTRELAFQIAEQFRALGAQISVRVQVVVGGLDMSAQMTEMDKSPHIIISTPGRLEYVLKSGVTLNFSLKRIKFLVLDEADRLLSKEFEVRAPCIPHVLKPNTHSQLKSNGQHARYASPVAHKAHVTGQGTPYFFDATPSNDFALSPTLTQDYLLVPKPFKDCYLVYLLKRFQSLGSIIIFVPGKGDCETVTVMLQDLDFSVAHLHSLMTQESRNHALHLIRSGLIQILVATDLASRGLDLPAVSTVINYNLPQQVEDYVHRAGRTARAGRPGRSISLVTQYDVELLLAIEERTQTTMEQLEHDEDEVLKFLNKSLTSKQVALLHLDDNGFFTRLEKYTGFRRQENAEKKLRSKFKTEDKETPEELIQQKSAQIRAPREKTKESERATELKKTLQQKEQHSKKRKLEPMKDTSHKRSKKKEK